MPHFFEPLHWGENSRSAEMGGAGLGLTIARRILQAHGGRSHRRQQPSEGAVFTGTSPLPLRQEPLQR